MSDAILVLNAGSSSLKFSVFGNDEPGSRSAVGPSGICADQPLALLLRGQIESLLTEPKFVARDAANQVVDEHTWPSGSKLGHQGAIDFLFEWGQRGPLKGLELTAAGHRVVHGGMKFTKPVRVDDTVLAELESLVPLAPLHQTHNIEAIRAVLRHAPSLPQVACFDTSFHRTQPSVAQHFAIPRHLTEEGILRYGFHGISYEYIASQLPTIDPVAANGRAIVAHLGNGASLCAMHIGISVATTMGLTPLDGLPMGTRCGAIDPSVLIYLMDRHGMDARSLERLLTYESGLLGVSGLSSDMRTLLEHESTNADAAAAIELFVYRNTREIGSLAAALGGLDAVVFTGGIGEHSPVIRERVCRRLDWRGLEFDETSNTHGGPRLSKSGSKVAAWVIPTNEELMIARHVQHVLSLKQI